MSQCWSKTGFPCGRVLLPPWFVSFYRVSRRVSGEVLIVLTCYIIMRQILGPVFTSDCLSRCVPTNRPTILVMRISSDRTRSLSCLCWKRPMNGGTEHWRRDGQNPETIGFAHCAELFTNSYRTQATAREYNYPDM
jgi:hypothetical protein